MSTQAFQSYGDIPARVGVQAVGKLLAHAEFENVVTKFATIFPFKDNKGQVIRFRRLVPNVISTKPLVEGVTPPSKAVRSEIVDFRIKQYGAVYRFSDWVDTLHEENISSEIVELAGVEASHVREFVLWGYLRSGTQVFRAGGAATRAQIDSVFSISTVDAATNLLRRNFAREVTEMVNATPNVGTEPIGAGFLAFGHIDLWHDIYEMDTFVPTYRYGDARKATSNYEIGSLRGNVRVLLAPHLPYWPDAGETVANAPGMRSDNNVRANVYPLVIVGREAYGAIPLKGMNSVGLTAKKAEPTDSDPLAQRHFVAWKYWFTGGILNQRWLVRIETAASELA